MKDLILSIAKKNNKNIKSMDDFYKVFPDEKSFMTKHGAEFKKAQTGDNVAKWAGKGPYDLGDPAVKFYPQNMPYLPVGLAPTTPKSNEVTFDDAPEPYGVFAPPSANTKKSKFDATAMGMAAIPVAGGLMKGFSQLKHQKEHLKQLTQQQGVTDVAARAAALPEEPVNRRYVRPEDYINTGEPFFPIHGVGTNVLTAKHGGEIHNTYAPNTLYKDLEEYQAGGFMQGLQGFMGAGGSDMLSNLAIGATGGDSAGASFGGAAADALNFIPGVGPLASMVAKPIFTAIGGAIDPYNRRKARKEGAIERNVNRMSGMQMADNTRGMFSNFMRTGGNITQNAMDGDLQVFNGGVETISTNPYLSEMIKFKGASHKDGGINMMFGNNPVEVEGNETAIKLQNGGGVENLTIFGNNRISKPLSQLMGDEKAAGLTFKTYTANLAKDQTKQNKIINKAVVATGDNDFSTPMEKLSYDTNMLMIKGADLKLKEAKRKIEDAAHLQSAINDVAEMNKVNSEKLSYGKIEKAKKGKEIPKADGGKEGLQPLDPTNIFGITLNASPTTTTSEQKFTSVPDASVPFTNIAKGEHRLDWNDIGAPAYAQSKYWANEDAYNKEWKPLVDASVNNPEILNRLITRLENYTGADFQDAQWQIKNAKTLGEKKALIQRLATDKQIGPFHHMMASEIIPPPPRKPQDEFIPPPIITTEETTTKYPYEEIPPQKQRFPWELLTSYRWRPTDTEPLDPRQLYGEMYALSNNQLEPVKAQTIKPDLDVPYDISYQDRLNEITAQTRAAEKMSGYNPAAAAMIAGQAYAPKSNILAEQFRANQAKKDEVYNRNRAIMNEFKWKNLDTLDKQYERQERAKSATKATAQAALSSIAAKYMQNKLENRTLGAYENLYNYRFDDRMKAWNWNPLQFFNTNTQASTPQMASSSGEIQIEGKTYKPTSYDSETGQPTAFKVVQSKHGSKVPYKNGGIVKAMKNF